MDSADIDRIVNDVKEAAAECGALLLEAVLPIEGRGGFIAVVAGSDFPKLIRHAKPKIVYLITTSFDAAEELMEGFEDDDVAAHPQAKRIIATWSSRNGQISRMASVLVCDGILHRAIEQTDWVEEFEGEVEQFANDMIEKAEIDAVELQAANEKTVATKAKQLMADPRFSGPKASIAKRTALAEELFRDIDKQTIRAIVDRAINDHWLATGK